MGRQISVIFDQPDEDRFFAFLRETADIAVYQSRSPTPSPVETMWPGPLSGKFWIHNRSFKWEPKFRQLESTDQLTGEQQIYFELDTLHAPVVEYTRHMRLYWAKLFLSQPKDLSYDQHQFDLWFTTVCRWIRRNGQKLNFGTHDAWCLPVARTRLQNDA